MRVVACCVYQSLRRMDRCRTGLGAGFQSPRKERRAPMVAVAWFRMLESEQDKKVKGAYMGVGSG